MADQIAEATPAVVVLPVEIDVTNSELALGLLAAAMAPGVPVVIADLTATSFCDTSGVRALVQAHEQAGVRGAQLRLAVPRGGSVRRVLELTGLGRVLNVYPGLDEAIAG
jgi:anti-sigma B factor antagonist